MEKRTADLEHPGIWTPQSLSTRTAAETTGIPLLDQQLPEGGWCSQSLYEINPQQQGEEELSLLLPSLQQRAQAGRWIGLIAPPKIAWASRFAQSQIAPSQVMQVHARDAWTSLWALEQALRTGTCSAVLAWPGALSLMEWRRLQLLARNSNTLCFVFQPDPSRRQASLVRHTHGKRPARIALQHVLTDNLPALH